MCTKVNAAMVDLNSLVTPASAPFLSVYRPIVFARITQSLSET
jgi:hypothetical protein